MNNNGKVHFLLGSGKLTFKRAEKNSLMEAMAMLEGEFVEDGGERILLVAYTMHDGTQEEVMEKYKDFFECYCQQNGITLLFGNFGQQGFGYRYISIRLIAEFLESYGAAMAIVYAPAWDNMHRGGNIAAKYVALRLRNRKQKKYSLAKVDLSENTLTYC